MSNEQLTAVTVVVLAAHLGALAISIARRPDAAAVRALNAAIALTILIYLGAHAKAFGGAVDWQLIALAVFEALVLVAAAMAQRRVGVALAGSWAAFGVHFSASVAAVVFVLTFKITRLI